MSSSSLSTGGSVGPAGNTARAAAERWVSCQPAAVDRAALVCRPLRGACRHVPPGESGVPCVSLCIVFCHLSLIFWCLFSCCSVAPPQPFFIPLWCSFSSSSFMPLQPLIILTWCPVSCLTFTPQPLIIPLWHFSWWDSTVVSINTIDISSRASLIPWTFMFICDSMDEETYV